MVLKELRTVVVAVRGTETLEDLLTDGLSSEIDLSPSDLRGLRKYGLHACSSFCSFNILGTAVVSIPLSSFACCKRASCTNLEKILK